MPTTTKRLGHQEIRVGIGRPAGKLPRRKLKECWPRWQQRDLRMDQLWEGRKESSMTPTIEIEFPEMRASWGAL